MAPAVRPSHLLPAIICLALHHLLACSTTAEHPLHARTNTTVAPAPATLPPHATLDAPPAAAAGPGSPAAAHRLGAPLSPWTQSDNAAPPRRLDVSVIVAGEDTATATATASATTTAAPPAALPSLRACGVDTRVAPALDDVALAPAVRMAALLPLLAVPFLPPPLAVLVALSSLATPVRASWSLPSGSDCSGLTNATCTVYRYRPSGGGGAVDRSAPFADLRSVCPHPRCGDGTDRRARSTAYGRCRGRRDDPFHGYCEVRTLKVEGDSVRFMPVHLPVADPGAAVAAAGGGGGDVCYVELEHMNYREGYYIRCPPARTCCQAPVVSCSEFPHNAVAAAVWDHRRLTYRDTVGSYTANDTARPLLQEQGYLDLDEL